MVTRKLWLPQVTLSLPQAATASSGYFALYEYISKMIGYQELSQNPWPSILPHEAKKKEATNFLGAAS